jgi:hypothetical protein
MAKLRELYLGTVSCLAFSYALSDIWRSVKYPDCTVTDNKVSAL